MVAPKLVPVLSESSNTLAQKPDAACPGGPEPQKTEEAVSETEGDKEASLGNPQEAVDTPDSPGEPPFAPVLHSIALDSEQYWQV